MSVYEIRRQWHKSRIFFKFSHLLITSLNAVKEDGGGFGGLATGNFLKSHSLDRQRMAIIKSDTKLKRMNCEP